MPVSQYLDLTEGSVELVAGMDDEKQALTRFGFACAWFVDARNRSEDTKIR
jgi:hypothetical protein